MFNVVINEKGGSPKVMEFEKPEVTIGRVQGNDIILPKGNISKRHSRIVLKDGKFIVVDLKSTNGTYVNGRKISSPHILKDSDKIYIGDYTLTVVAPGAAAAADAAPPPPPPPPPPKARTAAPPRPPEPSLDLDADSAAIEDMRQEVAHAAEPHAPPAPAPPRVAVRKVQRARPPAPSAPAHAAVGGARAPDGNVRAQEAVFSAVAAGHDLHELATNPRAAQEAARRALDDASSRGQIPGDADANTVLQRVVEEITGSGPLGPLLEDPEVVQIFVDGPFSVLVERDGELKDHDVVFSGAEAMTHVVTRMLASTRLVSSSDSAIVTGRLPDGACVTAVLPPVGAVGPSLRLTKPSRLASGLEDLVSGGVLSSGMAEFLRSSVGFRKNIVVSGNSADGAGVLQALAASVASHERVAVIEEFHHLNLPQPHVSYLVATGVDNGATDLRGLVRAALHLAPDRLVVSDCRGAEALDLMRGMAGVLDGSLLFIHGHDASDALGRLEAMIQQGGGDLSPKAIRSAIAKAIDIVVQVTRFAGGALRVTQIAVVTGMEVDLVTMQDVFTFRHESFDRTGDRGNFSATGVVPPFYEELQRHGEKVNMSVFRDED